MIAQPSFTEHFATLAGRYDVVLSDVWGVLHNGLESLPAACEALSRYRAGGGRVALITNAPRPGEVVVRLLDRLKVPRESYDTIVSSGDVTRAVMASAARQGRVPHRAGPRSADFRWARPALRAVRAGRLRGVHRADATTRSRPPESYRELLTRLAARDLFMLCGNPDLVVERGERLIYCAGALADLYGTLGGKVLYAGKPHRPIYDLALERIGRLRGEPAPLTRVLAIGDSVRTDLKGASDFGVDCLFVTAGIHAEELGDRHDPDLAALNKIFADAGLAPKAVTRRLMW